MYIIYDTETTGFPNPNVAPTSSAQARIIQLAALKLDKNFQEVISLKTYIKKEAGMWYINPGAQEAHGITASKCQNEGRIMREVLPEFNEMRKDCKYFIGHNKQFDDKMLDIEEANYPHLTLLSNHPHIEHICTMELTTPICKLPHIGGRKNRFHSSYKWPKLTEAYKYFFGEELKEAHDALADVRATARIFKHLVDIKVIDVPSNVVPLVA